MNLTEEQVWALVRSAIIVAGYPSAEAMRKGGEKYVASEDLERLQQALDSAGYGVIWRNYRKDYHARLKEARKARREASRG